MPGTTIKSVRYDDGSIIIQSTVFSCIILANPKHLSLAYSQTHKILDCLTAILSNRSDTSDDSKDVSNKSTVFSTRPPKPQQKYSRESAGSPSCNASHNATEPQKQHRKKTSNNSSSVSENTSKPNTRPPKPQQKYTKESAGTPSYNTSGNATDIPKRNRERPASAKTAKNEEPLKRLHTDTEALKIIEYALIANSFQASYVLERIVETEVERMNREKVGWKVAGAVAGIAFGASDGLQLTDLFTSFTFSSLGGVAHDFASKEQREFLRRVKSDWLISQKSALEIIHRLGQPRQRCIAYFPESGMLRIVNVHENPSRGLFLVPLGEAKDHAHGFKTDDSLTVLYKTFSDQEIGVLANQLYPIELIESISAKRISHATASASNPYHHLLTKYTEIKEFTLDGQMRAIAYKVPIPVGSEY